VSETSGDASCVRVVYHPSNDHSTLAEIQRKVVKRGKRSTISQLLHVRRDKEMTTAWKLDLNKFLHFFNVLSAVHRYLWPLLTFSSQTKLGTNTHTTIPDIRHDVANIHTVVSDVHCNTSNTNTTVSEVRNGITSTRTIASSAHRHMLKSCGDADSQNRPVSTTRTLSPTDGLPLPRLTLGQRPQLQMNSLSNISIQCTWRIIGKFARNHSQCSLRR